MNKPWKLIVLLVGIFVAGGATGALLAKRMAQVMPSSPKPPPAAETWASLHLKRIADDIHVKPDQMEQIRPIVVRGMKELFSMRSQFLADNRARREQMERDVMQVLTPEQREKYEKINREFQERTRKLEKGGPPPDRNGRPPGPPPDGFKKDGGENRPPPPDRPRDS